MKKTHTSPDFVATRRNFLKTIGGTTGAVVVGGFSAVEAAAAAVNPSSCAEPSLDFGSCFAEGKCNFSGLPPDFIYLNNGSEGTMPDCVVSTVHSCLKKWAAHPTFSFMADPELGRKEKDNRKRVADFLGIKGADKENHVCITNNTTMGLAMVLMGLNFKPDDKVVLTNHEHPAMTSPLWVIKEKVGIKLHARPFPSADRLQKMDADTLLEELFPNTPELRDAKALCVSHIYYTTGVRLPLDKLRKKADELNIPYLIVDGAHGLGMIDLAHEKTGIANCDFYACPGHKWLNGPPGTGVLYMRNPNLRPPEFHPAISEDYKIDNGVSSDIPPMAELLQLRGCNSAPSFAGMVRAMQFVNELGGQAKVEKHILGMSQAVKKIIVSQAPNCIVSPYEDPELASGATTFFPFSWNNPKNCFTDKASVKCVVDRLLSKNLRVRYVSLPSVDFSGQALKKSFVIRVSTGNFNTPADVEKFATILQEVLTEM